MENVQLTGSNNILELLTPVPILHHVHVFQGLSQNFHCVEQSPDVSSLQVPTVFPLHGTVCPLLGHIIIAHP